MKNFKQNIQEGIKAYFLPIRTVDIRFDSILTLSDYDLKNYNNIVISWNNLVTAFAKNFFILFDYK